MRVPLCHKNEKFPWYTVYRMLKSVKSKTITWIDIQNPTEKDIDYLNKNFAFHPLVLSELIPPGHRPNVEYHGEYIFMVLYYPALNKKNGLMERRELDIIVSKDYLITNHYKPIISLKALFDQVNLYKEAKKEYIQNSTGHLLHAILSGVLTTTLNQTEQLEESINHIEEEIFKGRERQMVSEISITKRTLIDVRRVLAPQGEIFSSLQTAGRDLWGKEVMPYLDDLRGVHNNIWNVVEEQRETLQSLAETNESLLSTKTNETMKLLTVIATITFPLTLLASIWGMNTPLPFADHPQGFFIVMGLMGITTVVFGLLIFLRMRRIF